jgi:hypothetical protein
MVPSLADHIFGDAGSDDAHGPAHERADRRAGHAFHLLPRPAAVPWIVPPPTTTPLRAAQTFGEQPFPAQPVADGQLWKTLCVSLLLQPSGSGNSARPEAF